MMFSTRGSGRDCSTVCHSPFKHRVCRRYFGGNLGCRLCGYDVSAPEIVEEIVVPLVVSWERRVFCQQESRRWKHLNQLKWIPVTAHRHSKKRNLLLFGLNVKLFDKEIEITEVKWRVHSGNFALNLQHLWSVL